MAALVPTGRGDFGGGVRLEQAVHGAVGGTEGSAVLRGMGADTGTHLTAIASRAISSISARETAVLPIGMLSAACGPPVRTEMKSPVGRARTLATRESAEMALELEMRMVEVG